MSNRLFLLSLHVVVGLILSVSPGLSIYYGLLVLIVGSINIIFSQNNNNQAGKWAAYFMGMEVFLRMTGGNLYWEAGKYGLIVLLLLGMVFERQYKEYPVQFIVCFFLMIPSVGAIQFDLYPITRSEISFNLSGPLSLIVSAIYFYRRSFTGNDLLKLLGIIIYPILAMGVYLSLVTPDIQEIHYGTESNFQATGGFGPNQVSTILGLAIFIMAVALFYRKSISGLLMLDVALLGFFIVRGLITFSRGGIMGGILALLIMVLTAMAISKLYKRSPAILLSVFLMFSFGIYIWNYVNTITKGKLEYRYTGVDKTTGMAEEDITSGRLVLLGNEIQFFLDNPVIGIGPGMVKFYHTRYLGSPYNTHSEISRLLAEHGLFGLIILVILVSSPFNHIKYIDPVIKPLYFGLFTLVIFTMLHSAMRIAMPGFLYGLIFTIPKRG